ncbi:hypothetical protein EsDP_00004647 [Epichloe bromicola]|uniref:Uncharacterized protein n=1 Tax=Epichloe bromicola TaxID=79588 RepID=A0ABQ0CSB7_9HYPO
MRFVLLVSAMVSAMASAAFAAPVDGDIVRDPAAIDDNEPRLLAREPVKIPECCSAPIYPGGSCDPCCKP